MSVDHGYQIIYKGSEQAEDKQLILIKNGEHFHACHSLKGFFGSSYYCLRCEKKYDKEDFLHYRCPGLTCYACHQNDCEDQKKTLGAATVKCRLCERCFFGPTCFHLHLHLNDKGEKTENDTVCQTYEKCVSCGKVLMGQERKKHICGYSTCPCCQEYLNLHTHQCYLQPVEDEERKRKRRQRKRKRDESCLAAIDPEFEPREEDRPPPPPLFVYFDIEARQEGGVHVANLLCAERHDDDEQFVFEGRRVWRLFWTGYEN